MLEGVFLCTGILMRFSEKIVSVSGKIALFFCRRIKNVNRTQ